MDADDPDRRRSSARRALLVIGLALALGVLLGAQGMHKTATGQPEGVRREVAMAVTGPLADVSHALYLDRPRRAVKWAVGREDDDTVDTRIAIPTPPPAARPVAPATGAVKPSPKPAPGPARPRTSTPAVPKPRPRPAFSPNRPLRLWVAGDSLAVVPGYALVDAVGANDAVALVDGGVTARIATGLQRPDVFNWFTEIAERMRDDRPRVVVLAFGGNDFHAYMSGVPAGLQIGPFDSPSWRREYARRVGGVLDTVIRAGGDVIWLGLPKPRSENMLPRFTAVNRIVEAEIEARPEHATYVDLYALLAGKRGRFAEYLRTDGGKLEKVRAADGIHLAPRGGEIVANAVLGVIAARFDLTSWRAGRSKGAATASTGP